MSTTIDFQHPTMRRVTLNAYQTRMFIGVLKHERKHKQPVIISVDVWVPITKTHQLTLGDVFDYRQIVEAIESTVSGVHIELQETLVQEIADRLLMSPSVFAVRVRSEKTRAIKNAQSVGVEIYCTRHPL